MIQIAEFTCADLLHTIAVNLPLKSQTLANSNFLQTQSNFISLQFMSLSFKFVLSQCRVLQT